MTKDAKHQAPPLAYALFLTLLLSTPLTAQQWVEISPEAAASHLLIKVAPSFPTFARAAGIEGVVSIGVGINVEGRIGSIEVKSGPPALSEAATDAVLKYAYKPFEQDGHRVNVQTTVEVVFSLSDHDHIPHPQPPPKLTRESFGWSGEAVPAARLSPQFRKWLASDLQEQLDYVSCADSEALSAQNAIKDPRKELPDGIGIIELPTKNRGTHLYVVNPRMNCLCGATGNCPIELVEENAGGVRRVAGTIGWGFYAYPHQDSPYPDIFIPSHVSCCEISVVGYSNVAGEWGQLYCGKIVTDGGQQETDDVQVCH